MDDGAGPVISSSDDRTKTWLIVAGGVAATVAALVALLALWPEDEPRRPGEVAASTTAAPGPTTSGAGTGEPSQQPSSTTAGEPAADLFAGGLPAALADLRAAAGDPAEAIEVSVYPGYAFLAYRDPSAPGNLDRRMWRDGEVGPAEPNPIADRVDAGTEPDLFGLAEVDPSLLEGLVADAPSRYDLPVEVTHVIIDRFLPFDERVLFRVYATPTDGRSGGGYVSYDTAGALVGVCC